MSCSLLFSFVLRVCVCFLVSKNYRVGERRNTKFCPLPLLPTLAPAALWRQAILSSLCEREGPHSFVLLGSIVQVGLLLCVFAREAVLPRISNISRSNCDLGVIRRNGAVALSLYVDNST